MSKQRKFTTVLERIVPTENKKRFYSICIVPGLFGDWALMREWGRIGQSGTVRSDWYDEKLAAQAAATDLFRSKCARGYVERNQ